MLPKERDGKTATTQGRSVGREPSTSPTPRHARGWRISLRSALMMLALPWTWTRSLETGAPTYASLPPGRPWQPRTSAGFPHQQSPEILKGCYPPRRLPTFFSEVSFPCRDTLPRSSAFEASSPARGARWHALAAGLLGHRAGASQPTASAAPRCRGSSSSSWRSL